MSRSLLETITDKARASYSGPITKETFESWKAHWFAVAQQWHAELESEGLEQTAKAVAEHIEWQKKYVQ